MLPKRIATLLVAAACIAAPARATDLANVLVDYTLTSWGESDGLPSSIVWAIAQDHEGYLWLGTDAGPVRFDGARFIPWKPAGPAVLPKAPVRALCATRDGAIWFGFGDRGGISRLHDGQVRNFTTRDGLPEAIVTGLLEDAAGTLWAGTTAGLFALHGSRWQAESGGLPPGPVHTIYEDPDHRLLVGNDAGVFRRDRSGSFAAVGVADTARGIAVDRRGRQWVTDPFIGFRLLNESRTAAHPHEQGRGNRLITDSAGNLWVGMARQGLWRVQVDAAAEAPRVEKTTALVGFSDDGVVSLFQDSSGNIWAGTLDGLNRLTPHKLTPLSDVGLVSGVEVTAGGEVWVGTAEGVIEFRDGSLASRQSQDTLPGLLAAMHADGSTLWAATNDRLFRYDGGHRTAVPLPGEPPRRLIALTSDRAGALWLADADQGLLRLAGHRVERVLLPADVRSSRIVALGNDRRGRVWVTFTNRRVAVIERDRAMHTYGRGDGLDAGVYRVVYEDGRGTIWLGGTEGVTRFSGGTFASLRVTNGFPTESATGIVEDAAGSLWLGAEGSGIVRIDPAEIDRALATPGYRVRYRVFDKFDGFAGTARWFGNRGAVRSGRGDLWFVSGRGVTLVDPRTLPAGPAPPARVRIEGIVADDAPVPVSTARLPPRTNRVQIDYTVLNLSSPLRTRFRYRLEGFDGGWVDAGSRRQAFYTNLPPRSYVFRAAASNDDGSWSEQAGVWAFTIAPAFYQTAWFLPVCLLAAAALVGAVWRLHVRRVRKEFALLLGERARLSREIHDTLLQGLFGVALRCDSLARSLEATAPWLQSHFLQMRGDIQDYIQEARQSIQDLRSPRLAGRELGDALRESLARATSGTALRYEVAVVGTPHGCTANVEQQLLRIGQEAVSNAVRHADARAVRVELHYDDSRVRLRVTDDGRGFDPASVSEAAGHVGLAAMRERAESVGGTLRVVAAAGQGAEIEAVVPRC